MMWPDISQWVWWSIAAFLTIALALLHYGVKRLRWFRNTGTLTKNDILIGRAVDQPIEEVEPLGLPTKPDSSNGGVSREIDSDLWLDYLFILGFLLIAIYTNFEQRQDGVQDVTLYSVEGDRVEVHASKYAEKPYIGETARKGCLTFDTESTPVHTGTVEIIERTGREQFRIHYDNIHSFRCMTPKEAARISEEQQQIQE